MSVPQFIYHTTNSLQENKPKSPPDAEFFAGGMDQMEIKK